MTVTMNTREHLASVANDVLPVFESIATKARSELARSMNHTSDTLACPTASAMSNLHRIGQTVQGSYAVLGYEPAIARVTVVNDKREQVIYYICRTIPMTGVPNLASYRAPVGRLASLDIGDELMLPNGRVLEVVDRTTLQPSQLASGWDSIDSVYESEIVGPLTVESLRALLESGDATPELVDLVGQLLSEETARANIVSGIRRKVITKMGLKDQPILDRFQDEVFRLPLATRLVLLGPPGTGKTTTLIRRLGQKLDIDYLDDDDRNLLKIIGSGNDTHHAKSWLMFTPNELLKQYLKEAFSREGVPASDQRIRTWSETRRELGRSVFGVLKTATGRGTYVLKDQLGCLLEGTQTEAIHWFEDFDKWQRHAFIIELEVAAKFLKDCRLKTALGIADAILPALEDVKKSGIGAMLSQLISELAAIQSFHGSLRAASDEKIKLALNQELQKNKAFLDELTQVLVALQQSQATDVDDLDEVDLDDDDAHVLVKTDRAAALNAYMQAVRSQAKAVATKRVIPKNSRNGKIIEWLGPRILSNQVLQDVGQSLQIQASARQFLNPVRRYVDGIHRRYRAFRKLRQSEGRWYTKEHFDGKEISPLELDIILLSILRAIGSLITRPNVLRDIENHEWASLKPMVGQFRNQILVDEATDFSPIQLACMGALSHPRLKSFFACGDFNQRLTTWGTRSAQELKWVFPDFEVKEVAVAYRQSRQLNELARAMIKAMGGSEQTSSLPAHVDSEGLAPTLLECASAADVIAWLADRIREIERFVGQLPSIAIFVSTENQVSYIAESLNEALAEHNIQVIACRAGQTVGHETNVRVFDIQHIKGLEFEAVFFVGIDKLASLEPELFDKYLYVGITRAATYLGITCEGVLPSSIEGLRNHFGKNWQTPGTEQ